MGHVFFLGLDCRKGGRCINSYFGVRLAPAASRGPPWCPPQQGWGDSGRKGGDPNSAPPLAERIQERANQRAGFGAAAGAWAGELCRGCRSQWAGVDWSLHLHNDKQPPLLPDAAIPGSNIIGRN